MKMCGSISVVSMYMKMYVHVVCMYMKWFSMDKYLIHCAAAFFISFDDNTNSEINGNTRPYLIFQPVFYQTGFQNI
jgi:hypothetical protein